jgi:hypothetical protein
MDERTKSIRAIEQKIAGETARVNGYLRSLGQLLLERSHDARIAIERTAYEKINDETARLHTVLRQIERDVERVNEIDSLITEEERLNGEVTGRLDAICPHLGRLVTEDEVFSGFSSPYKTQIDTVQQKIDGLNERLNRMTEKDNVFGWLGRNAQSLVIKSFLTKTEASLERIYAEAGAGFVRNRPSDGQTGSSELEDVYASAGQLWNENNEREERIAALKKEKQEILGSFGRGGSINRKKTEARCRIEHLSGELGDLYLRLGRKAEDPSTRLVLQNLFDDEMSGMLENAAHCREMLKDYEDQTARLKVSLEIDEERTDIEKHKKSIAVQRRRIAVAEEIIAQHDKCIAEADKRIKGLMHD